MAPNEEEKNNDSQAPENDSPEERAGNPFMWAWGREFIVGMLVILAIYEGLIVLLAPEGWRATLMPTVVIPLYGWAQWINGRKRRDREN
ncbi:hypothetical protein OG369_40860 [Streptomyces sp. NBC_01221]|uniref:hypothetical protein n=1 Tax=unclassified Streptomyces TaxID=2593676 RepID=UPI0022543AFC|nr:hypothetical protein [Streptomyces sp. NBC_01221]MCX4792171.1 hypothetical protein [Streptomyces sp. NBC_01221]